jgi:hypothetical protein
MAYVEGGDVFDQSTTCWVNTLATHTRITVMTALPQFIGYDWWRLRQYGIIDTSYIR